MQFKAGLLERLRAAAGSASQQATHAVAVGGRPCREHAADELGGAGYQDAAAHAAASTAPSVVCPSTVRSPPSARSPTRLKTRARSGSAGLSRPFSLSSA